MQLALASLPSSPSLLSRRSPAGDDKGMLSVELLQSHHLHRVPPLPLSVSHSFPLPAYQLSLQVCGYSGGEGWRSDGAAVSLRCAPLDAERCHWQHSSDLAFLNADQWLFVVVEQVQPTPAEVETTALVATNAAHTHGGTAAQAAEIAAPIARTASSSPPSSATASSAAPSSPSLPSLPAKLRKASPPAGALATSAAPSLQRRHPCHAGWAAVPLKEYVAGQLHSVRLSLQPSVPPAAATPSSVQKRERYGASLLPTAMPLGLQKQQAHACVAGDVEIKFKFQLAPPPTTPEHSNKAVDAAAAETVASAPSDAEASPSSSSSAAASGDSERSCLSVLEPPALGALAHALIGDWRGVTRGSAAAAAVADEAVAGGETEAQPDDGRHKTKTGEEECIREEEEGEEQEGESDTAASAQSPSSPASTGSSSSSSLSLLPALPPISLGLGLQLLLSLLDRRSAQSSSAERVRETSFVLSCALTLCRHASLSFLLKTVRHTVDRELRLLAETHSGASANSGSGSGSGGGSASANPNSPTSGSRGLWAADLFRRNSVAAKMIAALLVPSQQEQQGGGGSASASSSFSSSSFSSPSSPSYSGGLGRSYLVGLLRPFLSRLVLDVEPAAHTTLFPPERDGKQGGGGSGGSGSSSSGGGGSSSSGDKDKEKEDRAGGHSPKDRERDRDGDDFSSSSSSSLAGSSPAGGGDELTLSAFFAAEKPSSSEPSSSSSAKGAAAAAADSDAPNPYELDPSRLPASLAPEKIQAHQANVAAAAQSLLHAIFASGARKPEEEYRNMQRAARSSSSSSSSSHAAAAAAAHSQPFVDPASVPALPPTVRALARAVKHSVRSFVRRSVGAGAGSTASVPSSSDAAAAAVGAAPSLSRPSSLLSPLPPSSLASLESESVCNSVGSLFFLRYVCPALVAPHVCGITARPLPKQTARAVILVAKAVQSLANTAGSAGSRKGAKAAAAAAAAEAAGAAAAAGTEGEGEAEGSSSSSSSSSSPSAAQPQRLFKEPWMESLAPFVLGNVERVASFLCKELPATSPSPSTPSSSSSSLSAFASAAPEEGATRSRAGAATGAAAASAPPSTERPRASEEAAKDKHDDEDEGEDEDEEECAASTCSSSSSPSPVKPGLCDCSTSCFSPSAAAAASVAAAALAAAEKGEDTFVTAASSSSSSAAISAAAPSTTTTPAVRAPGACPELQLALWALLGFLRRNRGELPAEADRLNHAGALALLAEAEAAAEQEEQQQEGGDQTAKQWSGYNVQRELCSASALSSRTSKKLFPSTGADSSPAGAAARLAPAAVTALLARFDALLDCPSLDSPPMWVVVALEASSAASSSSSSSAGGGGAGWRGSTTAAALKHSSSTDARYLGSSPPLLGSIQDYFSGLGGGAAGAGAGGEGRSSRRDSVGSNGGGSGSGSGVSPSSSFSLPASSSPQQPGVLSMAASSGLKFLSRWLPSGAAQAAAAREKERERERDKDRDNGKPAPPVPPRPPPSTLVALRGKNSISLGSSPFAPPALVSSSSSSSPSHSVGGGGEELSKDDFLLAKQALVEIQLRLSSDLEQSEARCATLMDTLQDTQRRLGEKEQECYELHKLVKRLQKEKEEAKAATEMAAPTPSSV